MFITCEVGEDHRDRRANTNRKKTTTSSKNKNIEAQLMPDMMPGGREESKILSDGHQSITQSNKETLIK
jgi:hypothetical protein